MTFKIETSTWRVAALAAVMLYVPASAYAGPILVTGNTNGALATATGELTLVGNSLTLSITNTSPFDARITGLGFDLVDGDFTANSSSGLNGFTGGNVASFTFSDASFGNIPQFDDAVLDFGWLTGANFSGGSPNNGMAPGATLIFSASGPFPSLNDAQLASSLFVRFQRVGQNGSLSDVGRGTTDQVPEPASIVLLGTGLLAWARRRHTSRSTRTR
jgi:hypothetical protein